MPELSRLSRPQALSEEISARLAGRIAAGEFAPGDRLPTEKSLAEAFGVSRPVVREAIARLRTDGLVETRQGAGAFVAAASRKPRLRFEATGAEPAAGTSRAADTASADTAALREIFELRAMLEPVVAGLAARRAGEGHLAALKSSLDEMDAALATGRNAARADDAFHNALAAATGNRHVMQLMDFLGAHFSGTREVAWRVEGEGAPYSAEAQAEHHALYDAVAAGAAGAARDRSLAHVRGVAARAGITLPADLGDFPLSPSGDPS